MRVKKLNFKSPAKWSYLPWKFVTIALTHTKFLNFYLQIVNFIKEYIKICFQNYFKCSISFKIISIILKKENLRNCFKELSFVSKVENRMKSLSTTSNTLKIYLPCWLSLQSSSLTWFQTENKRGKNVLKCIKHR